MSDDVNLKELVHILAQERGLDLRGYKPSNLERRFRKRMHQVGVTSYPEYLEKLRNDPPEINELLNTVLINVTEFFRDPQAWDVLRRDVLVPLFASMKPGDPFRAWSAGCASGEEAYSLAMLVADCLGPRITEHDIKIYATDIDEEALQVARRGEYPADHLRLVRPEWRQRYFAGTNRLRIQRELRRMIIFGRSNLVSDAPISHCHLVLCRNVLIYFDNAMQRQVLSRLHYALEPNGVLFLGKAESKLTGSQLFTGVTPRWRIFRRIDTETAKDSRIEEIAAPALPPDYERYVQAELRGLRLQHRFLLDTVRSGVIELDVNDIVAACNDAARMIWGLGDMQMLGRRIQESDIALRCPEMGGRVEMAKARVEPLQFQCTVKVDGEDRIISVVMRGVVSDSGERTGTILNCEDITAHERLQATIEQLEATGEELQSANEELETTNEELQSTIEELETTNEELQSTNEELETTNEELHSLNEELENMNQELESRTSELKGLTNKYEETLRRMPWPVILVDRELKVQLWNAAAQKLFGVGATSVVGVDLEKLPADSVLMRSLVRRCHTTLAAKKITTVRNQTLRTSTGGVVTDVQLTPVSRNENEVEGVLIMFGPFQTGTPDTRFGHIPGNTQNRKNSGKKNKARAGR